MRKLTANISARSRENLYASGSPAQSSVKSSRADEGKANVNPIIRAGIEATSAETQVDQRRSSILPMAFLYDGVASRHQAAT